MWPLICLLSGLVMVICISRMIWLAGWKAGHTTAWEDITEEFKRYE